MAKDKETRYTREALLASNLFAAYQRDFLAAILQETDYTLAEAQDAVNKFFGEVIQ